jgi:cobalt/nickel transport system permease protein
MLIALVSRLPMRSYLGRATFFIPFFAGIIALPMVFMTPGEQFFAFNLMGADLVATKEGISVAAHFVFRVWLCVAVMILVVLTTEFPRLIRGLRGLGVPKVFTMMLLITFRYIQLYVNEALRMLRAKEARSFGSVGVVRGLRIGGSLVATLFTRSYERGERVYQAMLARGFDGETRVFNDLKLRFTDVGFGILLALASIALVLFDAGIVFPGLVGQLSGTLKGFVSW